MEQLETEGRASSASAATTSSGTANTDAFYEEKIKKLARLTQQGTVKWRTVDASAIPTLSFARVLTAYEADFGGERLRLIETGYERQSLAAHFSALSSFSSLFPPVKTNEMASIVLSLHLLDRNGRPTFKFPSVGAIYDLLSEIKMQQSDVAGFLSAIDTAVDKAAE